MTETRNDLEQTTRKKVAQILLQHVADGLDLYSQIKHAHWNVRGPHFISIHEFLDKIAEAVEDHTDEIAERAVQLGMSVPGTIRAAVDKSSLKPYPLMEFGEALDHLTAVVDALADYGAKIRHSIDTTDEAGDRDTSDLLTAVSRTCDKFLWMAEAHLDQRAASTPRAHRKSA